MNKLSQTQFDKELAALRESLLKQISEKCTGLSEKATDKKSRVAMATKDFAFFCQTYMPHYFPSTKRSTFQKNIFNNTSKRLGGSGQKFSQAAPRGEAKSCLCSVAMPLWLTILSKKRFILLISESMDQSGLNLASIQIELESNPRLKMDFPKAVGAGRTWQKETITTKNGCMLKTGGALKRIRGWRAGAKRPDLIVLDDLENDTNVRSKTQRDQLENWIDNSVLPMGPPGGGLDVLYVGTVLHYDSVLNRKLKQPSWTSHHFKSIETWPDRMDMWDQWEQISRTSPEEAEKFYCVNKETMEKGAKVSWSVRPLKKLMSLRLDGHRAFDREYQNDPGLDELAPFKNITIWKQLPASLVYYGAVDPSLGKNRHTGDPSAILVGGFDRSAMRLHTVVEDIARRPPIQIIAKIIEYQKKHNCLVWGVESTQYQEFLRQQLIEKGNEHGVPIPTVGLYPHTDKNLRIESIQPYVDNGQIQLSNPNGELYKQVRYFPEADYDDGPDALQMLWMLAVSRAGGIPIIKTRDVNHAPS